MEHWLTQRGAGWSGTLANTKRRKEWNTGEHKGEKEGVEHWLTQREGGSGTLANTKRIGSEWNTG